MRGEARSKREAGEMGEENRGERGVGEMGEERGKGNRRERSRGEEERG